jgi:hypothetical protein
VDQAWPQLRAYVAREVAAPPIGMTITVGQVRIDRITPSPTSMVPLTASRRHRILVLRISP